LAEIYALECPETGSIRYIGKANDASKRLRGHIRDAFRPDRSHYPLYAWIRSLLGNGQKPAVRVLEVCEDWAAVEQRLIAEHRANGAKLLNVAKGGDEPHCPRHIRAQNGRTNAASRNKRLWRLKLMLGNALERGYVTEATKAKMRSRPDVFAQFIDRL
jgi:hypothetical protein